MRVKPPISVPFLTSCDSKAEHETGTCGGGGGGGEVGVYNCPFSKNVATEMCVAHAEFQTVLQRNREQMLARHV